MDETTTLSDPETYDRDDNRLSPVAIEAGQIYLTSGGERIEILEDDARGSKPLVLAYPDRETDVRARMSRYSFADMASYDGFALVAEADDDLEADDDRHPGEFVAVPKCPECGRFMRTGYDGEGFPAAKCPRESCQRVLDVDELLETGAFQEVAA